jgi:lipoate synthase
MVTKIVIKKDLSGETYSIQIFRDKKQSAFAINLQSGKDVIKYVREELNYDES